MPASPRIVPSPHILSAFHPIIYVTFPVTALLFSELPLLLRTLSETYSHLQYSEEESADSLQHINENIEEIKQHLLDDSMVVKKGTDRLTVKIFPN